MAATVQLNVLLNEKDSLQRIKDLDAIVKRLNDTPIQIRVEMPEIDSTSRKVLNLANTQARLQIEQQKVQRSVNELAKAQALLGAEQAKLERSAFELAEADARLAIEKEKAEKAAYDFARELSKLDVEQEKTTRSGIELANSDAKLKIEQEKSEQAAVNFATQLSKLDAEQEKTAQSANRLAAEQEKTNRKTSEFGKEQKKTAENSKILANAIKNLAYILVNELGDAFRSALTEMKAVDAELVAIRKVTGASKAEMDALADSAYNVAKNLGATASQYLNAVAEFSRAGYGDTADQLGELAIQTARVGDTTQTIANQFLLSVDAAYKYNGSIEELTKVLDGANEIGNKFPTSVEKIAEGLGKVAPIAAQAHVGIDELTAAIGTITAVTQGSGQEASTALRALFLNIMGDTQTEIEEGARWTAGEIEGLRDILREYAPEVIAAADATGTLINPMEAIGALAQSMESGFLTEQKLMDMINDIGGKLRSSQLLALVQNWDEIYLKMKEVYAGAESSAMKEYLLYLDSWEAKTNQLNATWTRFVEDALNTDTVKGFLDLLIGIVDHLDGFGAPLAVILGLLTAIKTTNADKFLEALDGGFISAAKGAMTFAGKLGLAASALGLIVGLIQAYNRDIEIKRQKDIEEGKTAHEKATALAEQIQAFEDLKVEVKEGRAEQEELESAARDLAKALGYEGDAAETAAGQFQTMAVSLRQLTEAERNALQVSLISAKVAAEKEFSKAKREFSAGIGSIGGSVINKYLREAGIDSNSFSSLTAVEARKLVDVANAKSIELYQKYGADNKEYKAWSDIAYKLGPALAEFETAKENLDDFGEAVLNGNIDPLLEGLGETAEEGKNAANAIDEATNAIERFNKALEGPEKGDLFQSYADMFEKVKELYDNGMFGSNAFKQGLIGLMGEGTIRNAFGGDLSDAANAFFGSKFIQSVYSEGGDDYGANAASYIARHQKEFAGVDVTKANDGTLTAMVTDLEAFAASANMSVDAAAALTDAWGIYTEGSLEAAEGTEEVAKAQKSVSEILEDAGDAFSGRVADANKLKSALSKAGYSAEEVADAIETLEGAGFNVTGEAKEAAEALKETKKEAESVEETQPEVVVTADNSQAVSAIEEVQAMTIADKHFNIIGHYKFSGGASRAKGVKGSAGETALVNDEPGGYNPELIVDNGMAYIAGGGDPTIVHLNPGATVYTATETREIFQRSGFAIPSHANGLYTGIPDSYRPQSSGTGNKRGSGSSKSSGSSNPEDLLENIEKYIDEVLEKAKDALDEQIALIDNQLFYLKYQKEASEKATELEEARLELLEAEQGLLNANTERTVRYYNNLTGQWEWMADKREVLEAQEDLAEAQKKVLEAEYEVLENLWEELRDEIEKALENEETPDITKLLEQLSKSSASDSLDGLTELLGSIAEFTENPASSLLKEGEEFAPLMYNWLSGNTSIPGGFNQTMVYGISGGIDPKPVSQSNNTSIIHQNGGNTYINGVQIGSDMMDKPLSEILSVLPIYLGGN